MNRQQRRAMTRQVQKHYKVSKEVATEYVNTNMAYTELEEGTKVKLNYDFISRQPDWIHKNLNEKFMEWVEEHKDETFTVEYDEKRKQNKSKDMKYNVCLKEDTTEPKWLFITSTLTPLVEATIKLNNGETITGAVDKVSDVQDFVNTAMQRDKDNVDKDIVLANIEKAQDDRKNEIQVTTNY